MATPTAPQKQTPEERVRAANQHFYAAFESIDMAEMESVWAHNTKRVRIALSSIWIRVEGDVGWVACTEHVTTAFSDGFDEAIIQATNIFIRVGPDWLLVAHHASPLPAPTRSTVQ
jgi:hypothetical protein